MITAMISTLAGMIGGVLPEVMKEVRDTRNHQREKEFLELQNRIQFEREKAGLEMKIRESETNLMAEEVRAFRETVTAIIESQSKPTGIVWIDGFNAVLRPLTCLVMMALFVWTSAIFLSGVMDAWAAGKIANEATLANVIWGSMLGEAISAVLAFLFGYRSTRKSVG